MSIKEQIIDFIEKDSVLKDIYENNESCFKNIVFPRIKESDDDKVLETVIYMLAMQCEIYDVLLNNIAQFGNKELIIKSNNDINNIITLEDEEK